MNFDQILKKYRTESLTTRAQGDKFERLMKAYLQTDPTYANLFSEVWFWGEFPFRNQFGGNDTGIDLVAATFSGEYWAIQCKFYGESAKMEKIHIDSFITTSGRTFTDEDFRTTGFAHRLWVSTSDNWSRHAEEALRNQTPSVNRIGLYDLRQAPVDWEKLENEVHGRDARVPVKTLFQHQKFAVEKTHEYFKNRDRGKLIMACGTGKTLTSLRIAENETNGKGFILFLVPSISLLSQTLREWTADAVEAIYPICICSDPQVNPQTLKNRDVDSFSVLDLGLPASTDIASIAKQVAFARSKDRQGMTVVFSTYQSIEVIAKAQRATSFGEFDLIICDEAHRTTGVKLEGDDESAFTKVHNNDFIKAKKRVYMTATPRLYSEDSKGKAALAEAVVWSMDNDAHYGEEIYRIGFGEAVERELLTDYKVLILTLSEEDVPKAVQKALSDTGGKIETDDVPKLIGCINALSKQFIGDGGIAKSIDPGQMKRAVAFCPKITASKTIRNVFNDGTKAYIDSLPLDKRNEMVKVSAQHIDGTFPAPEREKCLAWLKAEPEPGECRVLTNVRCLSEGVDVPSLDAVMFLAARNSQVDVVQSVGRVMRKAEGKKFGYIIIPIIVPSDIEADKALDNNERYKVVWTVLNALRAHDDRFNATVNKINLNKLKPNQIVVGAPEVSFKNGQPTVRGDLDTTEAAAKNINEQLRLQFEELQGVVFARMVKKVGDRHYWEQWAKSVGDIAIRQVERIKRLIAKGGEHAEAFADFVAGLRKNINPSITDDEAIDMLSQHIITRPVFDALFEGYSFIKSNPVSVSMQSMLDILDREGDAKEHETLQRFYDFVRRIVKDLDNPAAKQAVVLRLYDNFFKVAFPKMVERLGIVYTPVEVVDFIIHSVDDVLQKEFGRKLADRDVHILDPFTGTGTFITRLIQSGLIDREHLPHKYKNEIFANEIVLLAYYIAAVNIENAYHDAIGAGTLLSPTADASSAVSEAVGGLAGGTGDGDKSVPAPVGVPSYIPFEGICLTDTFQLGENEPPPIAAKETFKQNSERVERQKRAPLKVIFGNPPYYGGDNEGASKQKKAEYANLDKRIDDTYAAASSASLKTALYNDYMKAFRWASDRIGEEGIIAYCSNGGWLTGKSEDGFRKLIEREFCSIWVLNLRGNAQLQGEARRKEGGNIFRDKSRSPIAVTILVRRKRAKMEQAEIFYRDIGDYLSSDQKIVTIKTTHSVLSESFGNEVLRPNIEGDWLNQRTESFASFISLGHKGKGKEASFFNSIYSNGVKTNRDLWVYNFSRERLDANIETTVSFLNSEILRVKDQQKANPTLKVGDILNVNAPDRISWSGDLVDYVEKGTEYETSSSSVRTALYRPFNKQHLYLSRVLNNSVYQFPKLFPMSDSENILITVPGVGNVRDFSALVTDCVRDLGTFGGTQCFPLYYYEEKRPENPTLFDTAGEPQFVRRDGISDFIAKRAKEQYDVQIKKEDIFYYVYGFLHSPEYRQKFANDLKKMLPRIPLVDELSDFVAFAKAGRKLADLHLNYESVPPYLGVTVEGDEHGVFTVTKMRFAKNPVATAPGSDKSRKDTILYNNRITVSNIPPKAYEYVINGKTAIEWIMERYVDKTDPASGIRNNANDWAVEVGNERYILDLLLSIINVSVQTVDIVAGLPKLTFDKLGGRYPDDEACP